jgi:hypothetical protein
MPLTFRCRCCGARSLNEEPSNSYEICDWCGWDDDAVQSSDPDYVGEANGASLSQYREDLATNAAKQEFWRFR